jgi:hypothetical protein
MVFNLRISSTFQVTDMGHSVILSAKPFLSGTQYGGFIYFRHTFQVCDPMPCVLWF